MNINKSTSTHTPSVLQFIFSGLAVLGAWGMAVILLVVGFFQFVNPTDQINTGLDPFQASAMVFTLGVCFLPSAGLALLRLLGKPAQSHRFQVPAIAGFTILIWPLLILAGSKLQEGTSTRTILFPIIHILAVLIPIFWLVWLGARRLIGNSPQLNAGLLFSGLTISTGISMAAELGLILVLLVVLIIAVTANPVLMTALNRIVERFSTANMDLEALQRILSPYLSSPGVILAVLGFFSVLTPLIEEAVKPIGLWFFARKELTPAQGFVAGMISGAGFTVFESMFNAGQSDPQAWLVVIITRVGTDALHILASGIVGWGLVNAWNGRHFGRLLGGYAVAVLLHGTWNGIAILFALSQLVPTQSASWLASFGPICPYLLGFMTILIIMALFLINQKLYQNQQITDQILPSSESSARSFML
jgi:hypothetical protein